MQYEKSINCVDDCVTQYLNESNNIFWANIKDIIKKHNCEYVLHKGKYTFWLDLIVFSDNELDVTNCVNELDVMTNLCFDWHYSMETRSSEIWVQHCRRDWKSQTEHAQLILKQSKSKCNTYYFACSHRVKSKFEVLSLEEGISLLQSILPSNQFRFEIVNGKTQMDTKPYNAIVVHDITLKFTQIKALKKVIKTEKDTYFKTTMGNYLGLSDIQQAQDFPTWI